jgi:hypothetical protein
VSIQKRSAEKKAFFDKIFADMKYCPICGGELKILGTRLGGSLKTCDANHGIMYVIGQRRGPVGMFLEPYEE